MAYISNLTGHLCRPLRSAERPRRVFSEPRIEGEFGFSRCGSQVVGIRAFARGENVPLFQEAFAGDEVDFEADAVWVFEQNRVVAGRPHGLFGTVDDLRSELLHELERFVDVLA